MTDAANIYNQNVSSTDIPSQEYYSYKSFEKKPPPQQHKPQVEPNFVYPGRIVRIESYGLFIELLDCTDNNHRPKGLCHISEIVPRFLKNIDECGYEINDKVFARVLEKNNNKLRLSLKHVNQDKGIFEGDELKQRHLKRIEFWKTCGNESWRLGNSNDEHNIWGRSPERKQSTSLSSSSSSSYDSSSTETNSSTSSSEYSRRRRKQRHSSRRDRRKRRRPIRKRRRYSSSSSSYSSTSSESSRSDSHEARSAASPIHKKNEGEDAFNINEEDLRQAQELKQNYQQNAHPSDDDSDYGPMPLTSSKSQTNETSASTNKYGSALLPGEGEAIAQYVQQNLRIPRRGEIGYTGSEIEKYENSGYVMSGSRHSRMNAVRIRKENQIYSAEEQRALALITMEENQQKESKLLEDYRVMLKTQRKDRKREEQVAEEEIKC